MIDITKYSDLLLILKSDEILNETVFIYKQIGNILTSEYSGGKIKTDHLIRLVDENGVVP